MSNLIALKQLRTGELGEFVDSRNSAAINSYTGYLASSGFLVNYNFPISTGVSGEYFNFQAPFSGVPYVYSQIVAPSDASYAYLAFPSEVSSTGFRANYSAVLSGAGSTGYYLNALVGTFKYVDYVEQAYDINKVLSVLGTGDYNLNNVVRTTGEQYITGMKRFQDYIYFYNYTYYILPLIASAGFSLSTATCEYDGHFYHNQRGVGISLKSGCLFSGTHKPHLKWGDRQLFGNWKTDTNPTNTGDIANKQYVDTQNTGLSGYLNAYIDLQITGLSGHLSKYPSTISDIATNNYIFTTSDVGKVISISGNSLFTGLVPAFSVQPFRTGDSISILQYGTGQLTISGSGCVINSRGGATKLAGQFAMAELLYKSLNSWVLYGDITV
jgi:hypothetical protein